MDINNHLVIMAGGFGYYLKPEDAAEIGLLPKELVNRAVAGGNTALLGAKKVGFAMRDEKSGRPSQQ